MGWFWADPTTMSSTSAPPNHPTSGTPPPSCPMHKSASSPAPSATSGCPYPGVSSSSSSSTASTDNDQSLNPLNFMFANLPQTRAPGQKSALPTERELSSIPKGTEAGNWEYPSPQQMYNAMRRKGYADAPEDAIESMVAVHNWLNEGAWAEISAWERKYSAGVLGYMGYRRPDPAWDGPKLVRFQGRRNDVSPKARLYGFLGRIAPDYVTGKEPFDRHDWYVLRKMPGDEKPREVRYVIDYYEGPPEPTGEPVFYLDVRPAMDRPGLVMERVVGWAEETWDKAAGLDVRRKNQDERMEAATASRSAL